MEGEGQTIIIPAHSLIEARKLVGRQGLFVGIAY